MPCANVRSKTWGRCGCTDNTPCRLGDAGSVTFSAWFAPRTEPPVQLREVGRDRGHLLTDNCSDVHILVYRTGDEDCCCCNVGSRRAKISLLVLALYLLDRGYCISVYCSSTGSCSSTRCCCCCCCRRCSSTRNWWPTISHPTESLVEHNCVSRSGYWLCVSHGPKAAVPRNPHGTKTTKKQDLT